MPELTREAFVSLWKSAKSGVQSLDPDLALIQRFMLMHDEMHEVFDRCSADANASLEVDGENIMLRIAMDAAVHKSLEIDEPAGTRELMQAMLNAGLGPGRAFNVMSQAMMHAFLAAASQDRQMREHEYLDRARVYAQQALTMTTGA